jgi:hypothetical protein
VRLLSTGVLNGFMIFFTATDAPVSWSFAELKIWSDGNNGDGVRKKADGLDGSWGVGNYGFTEGQRDRQVRKMWGVWIDSDNIDINVNVEHRFKVNFSLTRRDRMHLSRIKDRIGETNRIRRQ